MVNGIFSRTGEMVNGRPVWGKVGCPDICLWFAASNKWMVSFVDEKDANNSNGCCFSELGVSYPPFGKSWLVAVTQDMFEAQVGVNISILVQSCES